MRDDPLDLRVIDVRGRDEREHRPDVGVGLADDALRSARSHRLDERGVVGVDVEIDRLVLGHAKQFGGLLDRLLTDVQRVPGEGVRTLVPVQSDDVAADRPPRESVVVEDLIHHRTADGRSVRGGDAPLHLERRVGNDVAVGCGVEGVAQGRGPDRGGWRQLDDERPGRVRERDEDLDALRRLVEGHGLGELDAFVELGIDGRLAEDGVRGVDRCRDRAGDHGEEREDRGRGGDEDPRGCVPDHG